MNSATTRALGAVLLLSAVVLLGAGCGTSRLIRQADALADAGEHDQALVLYRKALEKDSDLAEDEEFLDKFKDARCLAAYDEGVKLAGKGDWDVAVRSFTDSLLIRPDFARAADALADAKRHAAAAHHATAISRADEGRLDSASAELQRALEYDADNAAVAEAMASLSDETRHKLGRADELYQKALALQARKQWPEAVETLGAALAASGNHLPARVERARCVEAMARTRKLCSAGSAQLRSKRLDQALTSLTEALEVWPSFEEAKELLADARARRDRCERLGEQAEDHFQAGRWEGRGQVRRLRRDRKVRPGRAWSSAPTAAGPEGSAGTCASDARGWGWSPARPAAAGRRSIAPSAAPRRRSAAISCARAARAPAGAGR